MALYNQYNQHTDFIEYYQYHYADNEISTQNTMNAQNIITMQQSWNDDIHAMNARTTQQPGVNDVYAQDVYYCNQCLDTSFNNVNPLVYKRCNGCSGGFYASADAIQRRIQNTVRVSQSEYLENLAGLNVYTPPVAKYGLVNWNQGSDRAVPAQVQRNVPSHGANSTKTSITRMRPGSCSAAGQGVDIKHGSYARYLARIKGRGPYRTQTQSVPAVEGNKTKKYGIAYSHKDDDCMCP
jgi:hypothetical protein